VGGVLVGVAAAVKLTPLIFVAHLLLTGKRSSAVRAFITFLGLQAVMFAISARDAWHYWTITVVGDPMRIGPCLLGQQPVAERADQPDHILDPSSTRSP